MVKAEQYNTMTDCRGKRKIPKVLCPLWGFVQFGNFSLIAEFIQFV